MPTGSTINITYYPDPTNLSTTENITSNVMYEGTTFTMSAGAVPGDATIRVKDPNQTLSFVTGCEITLDIDGARMWGGYIKQIEYTYAFPADNTNDAPNFKNRVFILHCVDYNIVWDKFVLRNENDYYARFPFFADTSPDGFILNYILDNYTDIDSTQFDIRRSAAGGEIDDVGFFVSDGSGDIAISPQGTTLRKEFERDAWWSHSVWFISPDKKFHWHQIEDVEKGWGFSDQPNYGGNGGDGNFTGSFWPFREVTVAVDGSAMVNDALVWGGSIWAGAAGGTVFKRQQNTTSQGLHNRWQLGELHFGEEGYGIQEGVDLRALAIVGDSITYSGSDSLGNKMGLKYPQWSAKFSWWGHQVPFYGGNRDHIRAGYLVHIEMNTFDLVYDPVPANSTSLLLPCRRMQVDFVALEGDTGNAFVKFTGDFALNVDDPWYLWDYLLTRQSSTSALTEPSVPSADDGSPTTTYGAIGTFTPTPAPDSVETVFSIPFGYISGTLQVFLNGLLQRGNNLDYIESDNGAGEFTMTSAPHTNDKLYVVCRTLGS